MRIGLSVQIRVEEEPRPGQEVVLTLPQLTEELNARETRQRHRNAIHKNAQLMADGVTLEIGLSVQLSVAKVSKREPEFATALLLLKVELTVLAMRRNSSDATFNSAHKWL